MTDLFPPFEPDGAEPPRRRFRPVPLRLLLPNLITLLALCAGLTAVRVAMDGRYELAIYAILAAAILDALDGRVARLLKGTSRFGAELDSLSDFVSFGAAPALILYMHGLSALGNVGWIASLLFAIASALRLARFNVMIDDPGRPDWQKDFFLGVPAPAAALVGLLPVYLSGLGVPTVPFAPALQALFVVGVAYLMVSKLPTLAGKTAGARVRREHVMPLFALVIITVGLLASFPFEVLTVGALAYLAALPLGRARWKALEAAARTPNAPDNDARPPRPAEPAPAVAPTSGPGLAPVPASASPASEVAAGTATPDGPPRLSA